MSTPKPCTLSISVVSHFSSRVDLARTLESLTAAIERAMADGQVSRAHLILIDNSECAEEGRALAEVLAAARYTTLQPLLICAPANRGYGAGNNLAREHMRSDFHLVLNPDVVLDQTAITAALDAMASHPDCVLLTPRATDDAGLDQYVAKGPPGVLTLLARALPLPARLRDALGNRRYELREVLGNTPATGNFLAGGCFMFCRTAALLDVGGFDEGYFMYFEDFDLSARLARKGSVLYSPTVRIRHGGGGAARKGLRHILWFGRSAMRFFRQHGWRWIS